MFPIVTDAKDTWILGAGPFQRGSIYDRTHFAGSKLLFSRRNREPPKHEIPLTAEAVFDERPELVKREFPISASQPKSPAASSSAAAPLTGTSEGSVISSNTSASKTAVPAAKSGSSISFDPFKLR